MSQKPLYAYVGTYTTENSKGNRNAHGVGIYVYEISRTNGRWKLVQEMPALNPAVLQFGKDQTMESIHRNSHCFMSLF